MVIGVFFVNGASENVIGITGKERIDKSIGS